MKYLISILVTFFTFSSFGQNKVIIIGTNPAVGGGLTYNNGALVTDTTVPRSITIAGLRALTISTLTGRYYYITDAGRQGYVFYNANDVTSADNSATIYVGSGSPAPRFYRIYKGGVYLADDIGAVGDGVTDNTSVIQAFLNVAKYCELDFTASGYYLMNHTTLPMAPMVLDGKGCWIAPYLSNFSQAEYIFEMDPIRTKTVDSTYGGGTSYASSRAYPKIQRNQTIRNFHFDAKFTNASFAGTGVLSNWSAIENVTYENLYWQNSSAIGLGVLVLGGQGASATLTDSIGYSKNIQVNNCQGLNNGKFMRLEVDSNQVIGDTVIKLYNLDPQIPITTKLQQGFVIQFACSDYIADVNGGTFESGSTWAKSNAFYRVKSFASYPGDTLHATITIGSGTFNSSTGFLDDITNVGLHQNLKKKIWIIPTHKTDYPQLEGAPGVSCTNGSAVLTILDTTTALQKAYRSYTYTGEQIWFASGPTGIYTVQSWSLNTITLTAPVNATSSSVTPQVLGVPGNDLYVQSPAYGIKVNGGRYVGGGHFVFMSGSAGPGILLAGTKSDITFTNVEASNHWMNSEETGNAPSTTMTFPAPALNAGDSVMTPGTPANFQYYSVTINGNAVDCIGPVSVTASINNTLAVGDVIQIGNERGRYRIISILHSSPWTITVHRWDGTWPPTGIDQAGGYYDSLAAPGNLVRVYSIGLGGYNYFGTITYQNCKFSDPWRPNTGYNISNGANEINILGGEWNTVERPNFEVGGNKVNIIGIKGVQRIWDSTMDAPGVTTYGAGLPLRGVGAFCNVGCGSFRLDGATMTLQQPDSTLFSSQVMNFTMYGSANLPTPYYPDIFIVKHMTIVGPYQGRLFFSSAGITSGTGASSYPNVYFKNFEYSDNRVEFGHSDTLGKFFGVMLGEVSVVKNNTFVFDKLASSSIPRFFEFDSITPALYRPYTPMATIQGNVFSLRGLTYGSTLFGQLYRISGNSLDTIGNVVFTPTTGNTVTLTNNANNYINPSGGLTALTLTFPSGPANGDKVTVIFEQAITTVTYPGTVVGGVASPPLGPRTWIWNNSLSKWL